MKETPHVISCLVVSRSVKQLVSKDDGCVCVLELKEEVVYYDVCEDAEELQSIVYPGHPADSPVVRQLKRRLQNLEMKRGNICARRAYLRNKKVRGRASSSVPIKLQSYFFRYFFILCGRISAWRPRSRSTCRPSRAPFSSASTIRFIW